MAKQVKTISTCRVCLQCMLLLIGMVDTGFGQTYQMDAVYVSASRLPTTQGISSRLIAVLDSAEIAQIGAHSITELLNTLPGIHSRTRGPKGVQTDLEMVGATYSQVVVMVDGMRVNDPQTGHHTFNLPLRPQDLQRVELV
ncbi:MAG: TonB-dependent receptor plug domain-containing protein, partial [Pseudomonadota bacterium]|nr:TonB-dependent receptor plug domain-containing protein [Pseudomonadota bacterium]